MVIPPKNINKELAEKLWKYYERNTPPVQPIKRKKEREDFIKAVLGR
ncbi:MAG: hypothetical protein K6T83_17000 [Alicyclobacillus sp.]|nr:hypothetical protein [Alicyclobacillus sp.]